MAKRILWLLDDSTLRKNEVPMLISLGYEVFCPKTLYAGSSDPYGYVTGEYDSSLTIPEEVLQQLNEVDFHAPFTPEIQVLMNEHFDICFCTQDPWQGKRVAKFFKGIIVVRYFGSTDDVSYTGTVYHDTLEIYRSCGNRFWFGVGYDNTCETECDYLRNRSIYLPLGLKDSSNPRQWKGGDDRFLFICPEIMTDPYYEKVYEHFKKNFRGEKYVIGGHQFLTVPNDPAVTGTIPEDEYIRDMSQCACLYYPYEEKRHLHFHVAEAIKMGVPVVFMKGGMLDHLAGGSRMPGRCSSVDDAKKKIRRLCKGDTKLAKSITDSQEEIRSKFSDDYVYVHWSNSLARMLSGDNERLLRRKKRIAIILPLPYTGGVLQVAERFVRAMIRGAEYYSGNVEFVFGYPDDSVMDENAIIHSIIGSGVNCRKFVAKDIKGKHIAKVNKLKGYSTKDDNDYHYGRRCILDDDMRYFGDCDYLIYIADRSGNDKPVYSEKPYAMVAHDCIQRYVPESVPAFYKKMLVRSYRECDHIFALSEPTKTDCIQYGGIEEHKVSILPLMYEMTDVNVTGDRSIIENITKNEYFVWSTNISPHKNHLKALEALSLYYKNGGLLDCIVTGSRTKELDPDYCRDHEFHDTPYIAHVHELIETDKALKEHVHFAGNIATSSYQYLLKNARFFFHPGYADNGNMAFFDSATFGVPTLSSDYPAMRYCADFTGIPVKFVDALDVNNIAEGLLDMERNGRTYSDKIPSVSELEKKTILHTWKDIYKEVCAVTGIEVKE